MLSIIDLKINNRTDGRLYCDALQLFWSYFLYLNFGHVKDSYIFNLEWLLQQSPMTLSSNFCITKAIKDNWVFSNSCSLKELFIIVLKSEFRSMILLFYAINLLLNLLFQYLNHNSSVLLIKVSKVFEEDNGGQIVFKHTFTDNWPNIIWLIVNIVFMGISKDKNDLDGFILRFDVNYPFLQLILEILIIFHLLIISMNDCNVCKLQSWLNCFFYWLASNIHICYTLTEEHIYLTTWQNAPVFLFKKLTIFSTQFFWYDHFIQNTCLAHLLTCSVWKT